MRDQNARGWYVYRTLKQTADRTQAPVKACSRRGHAVRSFWGANVIFARGDRALVQSLAARPDVKVIESNDSSNWLAGSWEQPQASIDSSRDRGEPLRTTRRAGRQQGEGARRLDPRFHGPGNGRRNQDTGMRWTHNALKPHYRGWNGSVADHNYNWCDSIHSGGGTCAREHAGALRRSLARNAHDRHDLGDDRAGQPDRRRSRSEVDRLPEHGSGERKARDLHRVLPVLHRSDRSQRQQPGPDDAAARDEQQLGLPAERAVRRGHPPPDRREHRSGRDLRRGLCGQRRLELQHRHRPARDLRSLVLDRRAEPAQTARELQQPRPGHGRRLRADQAEHRGAGHEHAFLPTRATPRTRAGAEPPWPARTWWAWSPSSGRRTRPRAGYRRDQGAPEDGQPERHRRTDSVRAAGSRSRTTTWGGASSTRSPRTTAGRSVSTASTTTASATSTTTTTSTTGRVDVRRTAAADGLRACGHDRRHLRLCVRRLLVRRGRLDPQHRLPL